MPENGGERRRASERKMMSSKTINGAFPCAEGRQGIWFRSEDWNDGWGDYNTLKSFVFATREDVACLSLILDFFSHHTGKMVYWLGHYCPTEHSVMMTMFLWIVGAQVFTGLWS